MVNSGTQFGKVIIKVARRARAGQTLPQRDNIYKGFKDRPFLGEVVQIVHFERQEPKCKTKKSWWWFWTHSVCIRG